MQDKGVSNVIWQPEYGSLHKTEIRWRNYFVVFVVLLYLPSHYM